MTVTKVGIELEVRLNRADEQIKRLTGEVEKLRASAEKAGKSSKDLGDFFKFNQVVEGARNIIGALQTIDQLAQRVNSFANVMGNAAFSIDKARVATRGMVDDFELQRLANNAALLKIAESDEAFAKLAGAAQKLGASIGLGPVQSMESLQALH